MTPIPAPTEEKRVTRVDLESFGDMVVIRRWYEGWKNDGNSLWNEEVAEEGTTITSILARLEKQGFAVWMKDRNQGRALRGKITRIDFALTDGVWTVKKYPYGWTAKTRALTTEVKPADFVLESAIAWLEGNGWTVYRWEGGARAWDGDPMPVRDRFAIMSMRRKVNAEPASTTENRRSMNLAFYF